MKDSLELFSILTSFRFEIKNQFNKSILILLSDNAREYFVANFSSYLSLYGILYRFTYPQSLQQNRVTKHKKSSFN